MGTDMNWADIVFGGLTRGFTLDDPTIEKLTAAATAITAEITDEPGKLLPYTLVGFDPTAPSECPAFADVEQHILTHWKSFLHAHSDRPQLILRAVLMLGVLEATSEPKFAAAVYVTLLDVFPRLADQSEHALHARVMSALQPVHATLANEHWTTVPGFAPKDIRVPPRFQINFNKEKQLLLAEQISKTIKTLTYDDASGNVQNLNIKNNAQIGNAIAEAIMQVLDQATNEINTSVPKYFRSADEYHGSIQAILTNAITKERQQSLLWWLSAKYSRTRQVSYRTLTPFEGALQMAVDFNMLMPPIAPTEVEAVLIEAVHATYPDAADETQPLEATLRAIQTPGLSGDHPAGCRQTLAAVLDTKADRATLDVAGQMGLNRTQTVTPAQLATWLLHALQARNLIS